jgi:hypothetical protein
MCAIGSTEEGIGEQVCGEEQKLQYLLVLEDVEEPIAANDNELVARGQDLQSHAPRSVQ